MMGPRAAILEAGGRLGKDWPDRLQARDIPKRLEVLAFLGWAAIRESRVSSDCLVGTPE